MASRLVCVRIGSVKNNSKTQNQFSVYERKGQLVFAINSEKIIPENAPVRLVSAVLEELNYEKLCRSIQVEGAFALLKNDFGFRRFLTKGKTNIRAELFLLAMAFDLKKLWMKREHGRLKPRVSEKMTTQPDKKIVSTLAPVFPPGPALLYPNL